MPYIKSTCLIALTSAALLGCATDPTWTNLGPAVLDVSNGWSACHVDANIIDGERIKGTLCATSKSGAFGGDEPEIYFAPQHRRLMKEYVSKTTAGVTRDWKGQQVFLQCDPTLAADGKTVETRLCKVTINNQLLISATVKYVK